ncbi:asparagine synthase (glutamine-hydrolyzing) [Pseudonocardia endophytica]|uniref:asparagine synthase (glutamine-hydrolyzing) n=1 Tax=Pseudonocardia endophytica TaxID=401976 RepID=A0A4R1HJ14_PSEEN|nr:asparagine synthase (glutamine-hydrolyzing) [Pseudonocardia endophytica]TCK22304.1 asparagine synthase (glutamine-hydrolysing) [Pseudonocardia endophytica]
MCGITGWVDYRRDLNTERAALAAMTDTMSCRGPDAAGIHIDGHAALGHRRLAIIDLDGGAQPMVFDRAGHPGVAITYSGEAYNFRELARELTARGHELRTTSDTEVVLHAYLEWGAGMVEHLNGMYAFAIWDARTQELLLVRDRMGIKPLYFHDTGDGVLFGSEPKAILANGLLPPVVDADGFRELFAQIKSPGRTYYRGMREVQPGHVVRVRPEGVTEHRYWALEATEHTDDLPTTVAHVRELLEDVVARQMVADVPQCTLLSGGLDSSAITALAQRTSRAAGGGAVRSFSVDFSGRTENFRAEALRATPDAPFVADLAGHVGSDHTDIVLDTAELLAPDVRSAAITARDAPTWGDMDTSLYLLFRAVRERSTVALSGESADEVFGGYSWFHDPAVVDAPTFPWLAAIDNTGTMSLLDRDLAATLDLGTYIGDSYAAALADVPRRDGETGHERRMREISHLHLTRFVRTLLDRKDRLSMAVGLEVRVPFCDHRLVQYVFNAPWSMKTFDGREKTLLRAAVSDLLPTSVLERVKVPYPTVQDPGYHAALQDAVGKLVADGQAPALRVFDIDVMRAMAEAPPSGDPLQREGLESVLAGNEWAERYDLSIEL